MTKIFTLFCKKIVLTALLAILGLTVNAQQIQFGGSSILGAACILIPDNYASLPRDANQYTVTANINGTNYNLTINDFRGDGLLVNLPMGPVDGWTTVVTIKCNTTGACGKAVFNGTTYSYTESCVVPPKIETSDFAVCEGSVATLTAAGDITNSISSYQWQKQLNGGTWQNISPTGKTITVEIPYGTNTFRWRKRGSSDAWSQTASISGVICCTNLDDQVTVFKETFGTVTPGTRKSSGYVKGHTFVSDVNAKIDDGQYAIVSNSTDAAAVLCDWPTNKRDHTGNTNGGFLLVNVNNVAPPILLYEQTISPSGGFCISTVYNFSIWTANIAPLGTAPTNFYFKILDGSNRSRVLGEGYSGDVTDFSMSAWHRYGVSFKPENATSVVLQVYNMGIAGSGNDVVIDDISVSVCKADMELYTGNSGTNLSATVNCGESVHLRTVPSGSLNTVYGTNNPYYLWLKSTNGTTWTKVTGGYGMTTADVTTQNGETAYYKVIVASTEANATSAWNNTGGSCTIYTESNKATVKCNIICTNPTISIGKSSDLSCANKSVTLTASATGSGVGYKWSGGGTASNKVVSASGTYTVTATVTGGCSATKTINVTSNTTAPTVSINNPETITCSKKTVTLSANATNVNYKWSNGNTSKSFSTTVAGIYSLSVTATSNGCTASASKTVNQDITNPTLVLQNNLALNCNIPNKVVTASVTAKDGHAVNYAWSDGSSNSDLNISTQGNYSVVVTDQINSCSASANISVTDDKVKPTVTLSTPNKLNCDNPHSPITASATNVTFAWNNNLGSDSEIVATHSGTYVVTVTSKTNGCTNTASVDVEESIDDPTAIISNDETLTCDKTSVIITVSGISKNGAAVSYKWNNSLGTGTLITVNTPATYRVTVTNLANLCSVVRAVTIDQDIDKPTITTAVSGKLDCSGNAVTLTATATDVTYTWSNGLGSSSTAQTTNAQTYTVTAKSNINGCSNTATVTVEETIGIPTVSISTPYTITCDNPSTILTVSAQAEEGHTLNYLWSDALGTDTQVTVTEANLYYVTVIDDVNKCSAEKTINISKNIVSPTVAIINNAKLDCANTQITLSVTSNQINVSYEWNSGVNNPFVEVDNTDTNGFTYEVTVTNLDNGCSSTANATIDIDIAIPTITIPAVDQIDCIHTSQTLTANVQVASGHVLSYLWNTGATNSQVVVSEGQIYELMVTDETNHCSSINNLLVKKDVQMPKVSIPSVDQIDCIVLNQTLTAIPIASHDVSYQWNDNSTANSLVVIEGNTYTVNITDKVNNCTASASISVTKDVTNPTVSIPTVGQINCKDTSMILSASATANHSINYLWNDNSNESTLTVSEKNTYSVIVTDIINNCTASASLDVDKNVIAPTISIPAVEQIDCTHTSRTLTVNTTADTGHSVTYLWNNNSDQSTLTITEDGIYNITVTDNNNFCSVTGTQSVIKDITMPSVQIPAVNQIDCKTTQQTLLAQTTAAHSVTYLWNDNSDKNSLVVTEGDVYSIQITDTQNHCTASTSISVTKDITSPTVSIPAVGQIDCKVLSQTLIAQTVAIHEVEYKWDDNSGNSQLVVTNGDTYNVVITDKQNFCTASASVSVTKDVVKPTVNIPVVDQIDCMVSNQTLIAQTSAAHNVSYKWNDYSTANSLVVTNGAIYSVVVTDDTNNCTASASISVTKDVVNPSVNIPSVDQIDCKITERKLTAIGSGAHSLVYKWNTNSEESTITVTDGNRYSVSVTDNSNHCTASATTSVTKDITAPTVSIPAVNQITCKETSRILSAQVNAAHTVDYLWNDYSTSSNIKVTEKGSYQISVTDIQNSCTASATIDVDKDIQAPEVTISGNDILTCNLLSITLNANNDILTGGKIVEQYQWSTGSSQSSIEVTTPNTYNVKLTYSNGCTASTSIETKQNIKKPDINPITGTLLLCEGEETTLTNLNAGGVWSIESMTPGTVASINATTGQLTTEIGGSVIVGYTITGANGCISSITAEVEIETKPIPAVPNDLEICYGDNIEIPVSGAYNYYWTPAESLNNRYSASPIAQPTETTEYEVMFIKGVCMVSEKVKVVVNELPNLIAEVDMSNNVTLIGELGAFPYQYAIDERTYSSADTYNRLEGGNHKAYVIDSKGCKNETEFEIFYLDIEIPAFFSPNNDGINDTWEIKNISMYPEAEIIIYDRFGKMICNYKGADRGWDGLYRSIPQPSTDYWYIIHVPYLNKKYMGHVTLKR